MVTDTTVLGLQPPQQIELRPSTSQQTPKTPHRRRCNKNTSDCQTDAPPIALSSATQTDYPATMVDKSTQLSAKAAEVLKIG